MDNEFDDELYDDEVELGDDVEFEGDDSSDGSFIQKNKKLISIISAGVAAIALVVAALYFIPSMFSTSPENDVDNKVLLEQEYQRGLEEGKREAEKSVAEKDAEIDRLSASIKESKEMAANAEQRAMNSDDRNSETLKDAQAAIDKVAQERDSYKMKYENARDENSRLHNRIKVLESEARR